MKKSFRPEVGECELRDLEKTATVKQTPMGRAEEQ